MWHCDGRFIRFGHPMTRLSSAEEPFRVHCVTVTGDREMPWLSIRQQKWATRIRSMCGGWASPSIPLARLALGLALGLAFAFTLGGDRHLSRS